VLWEFDASPEFSQLLGSDRIDFVVDDDYQTFEMNVYQGRVEERWMTSRFRFRISFEFTERVANADEVVIRISGEKREIPFVDVLMIVGDDTMSLVPLVV